MTSITHSSPALVTRRAASTGRFRLDTDSKAVRMGLGVAIAALLAGDVYAVLRSPVSERPSSSTAADSAHAGATTADAVRRPGAGVAGGFDALDQLGEAAYGDVLAAHSTPILSAAAAGAPAVKPAVPASLAATMTPPETVAPGSGTSSFLPPVAPAAPRTPDGAASNPPATERSSLVDAVVQVVEAVPVVGPAVAPVVDRAVDAAPAPVASAVAPAESGSAPIVEEIVAVPMASTSPVGSGLSL